MACYAAMLSLFHTLTNIKLHPRPPISLHHSQVNSLTQTLTFLLDFLERYSTEDDHDLETRITAAAHLAEDLIETYIVDRIDYARSATNLGENYISIDLYEALEEVIVEMDLITSEVTVIIQERIMKPQQNHQHTVSSASTWHSSEAPVFDCAKINDVLDKLTGKETSLQIISIVGMGGIGKTTFARCIYTNRLTVDHFDILAWVTISQKYSRRGILKSVYQEVKGSDHNLSEMSEDQIGESIYKHLWGRRYLIVMDDIWDVDAWYKVKSFFPHDSNRSRIMMTTRITNLVSEFSGSQLFQMQFMDKDKSWDLLCKTVFDKSDCPAELENTGKEIAVKCRGLPLSLAVIGGLLRKSNKTPAYWMYTLENVNSLVNLENDEYTLQILSRSYKELPMHLKPCFLYMGIFPEDYEIKISMLIMLLVAEGILRPIDGKSLEEVAEEYLKELIDRNLIIISKLRWDGKAKSCKVHDLLRDVCLVEAQKQMFFCVLTQMMDHAPQDITMERCICINLGKTATEYSSEFLHIVESATLARSFLYEDREYGKEVSPSLHFTLLRIYSSIGDYKGFVTHSKNAIFEQTNLRYVNLHMHFWDVEPIIHSWCSLLWNLQILRVVQYTHEPVIASEIWEMPLLRHADLYGFVLPDPPDKENNFPLENLQKLSGIYNLKLSDEVIRRIPNIRVLKVSYVVDYGKELPNFYLNNLSRLQNLVSLKLDLFISDCCDFEVRSSLVSFPCCLKKLILFGTRLTWEECTIKIGSLPFLQVLSLDGGACVGPNWETIEGKFCHLKFLLIMACNDLKHWETDCGHFPSLEYLGLKQLQKLEEIPSSIGDIPTLKTIRVEYCSESAADSAKRIKEEQEEYENDDLKVEIIVEHIVESTEGEDGYESSD